MKWVRLHKLNNTFVRGGIYLAIANFIVGLLNYLFNVLVGRALGPQGFSEIAAINSYLFILSSPFIVITVLIIQKIGSSLSNKYGLSRSIEYWFIHKIKRWWYIFILPILLIPVMPKLTNLSPVVSYSLIPILFALLFGSIYDAIYQGNHWFGLLVGILIFSTLIKLTGAGIVLLGISEINILILFIFLSFLIKAILSSYLFHKKETSSQNTIKKTLLDRRIIHLFENKLLWITTLSLVGINVLNNFDVIFVKKFFDSYQAGIYGAWNLFGKIIYYVLSPILSITYVYFTDNARVKNHNRIFFIALGFLIFLGCLGLISYIFFGTFIIKILFGNRFLAVQTILPYAGIFGILYVCIALVNNYFIAKKSKAALILPISLVFYIIILCNIHKEILHVILLNIFYALTVLFSSVLFILSGLRKNSGRIRKSTS